MPFGDDTRGQAIQIGAVLLLGALVLSFSLYQAVVVPDQNREVEFKHNQEVQGQLQDLRNALVSVADGGDRQSVSVDLGTQYPSRVVALNPGPPSGAVSTVGTTNASVNATVANAEAVGETGDFWNGSTKAYGTGALVYRPGYNEYNGAPSTWYEHSVLYNRFSNANLTLTGQQLVDGDRISLVALNGSYYASRSGSVSLDVRPVSASTNTVSVTNATADTNVTVTVPTRLSLNDWEQLLSGEFVANGGNVVRDELSTTSIPDSEFQLLQVVLQRLGPGESYEIQLARAGVGSGVVRPEQAYLTDVAGNGSSVPEGGTTQLTVEVRDRFDNPVSGAFVYAGTSGSGDVSPAQERSDSDGEVTLTYKAPPDISGVAQATRTVNASLNVSASAVDDADFDPTTPVNVTMTVRVDNSDGSGLGGGGGGGAYAVNWLDPSSQTGIDCPTGPNGVCTVNASETASVDLIADTTPTADGATVEYAVNNSSVGTVSPASNTTEANGEAATTFTPASNGNITVYAASGGNGDRIQINVVGASGGSTPSNQAPSASFTPSSTTVQTGESINFDASGSNDPDGSITSYEWDWTDDGSFEGSGSMASHSYPEDGTYTVRLRVTDNDGATDTATETITVTNRAPTASFTPSCSGLTCTFNGSGSSDPDGTISGYQWAFGDGNSGSGETTSHTYASGGTYDVTLTVTDNDGDTGSTTQSVTVTGDTNPPTVSSVAFNDTDNTINDSEANANARRTVSLTFNETMDTSIQPTITYENVSDGGNTYTVVAGGWADATTYEQTLQFADNDVDETVTVVVADARDDAGNQMATERPFQFTVDTQLPGDANAAYIVPDVINASNENAITVSMEEPDTLYGDETAVLNVTNTSTGQSVVVSKAITGANGVYTNITGVDVSGLPDGSVYVTGYVRDDAGNRGGRLTPTDQTVKDTVAPTISDYRAVKPTDDQVQVIFNSSEPLDTAQVNLTFDGALVEKFVYDNNISQNGIDATTYEYTTNAHTMQQIGEYNATLTFANDSAGNTATTGQRDSVFNGTSADIVQQSGTGQTGTGDNAAIFTLENTGPVDVTIQNITVVSTASGDPDVVGNGSRSPGGPGGGSYNDVGPELRSNRTGGLVDTTDTFDIGTETVPLNVATSTIQAGQRTQYTLAEFRKNNFQERSPGSSVTVRFGFEDGSEVEIQIQL